MTDEHCRSRMCRRRLSRLQSVNEFKVSEKPVQKQNVNLKLKHYCHLLPSTGGY